MLMDNAKSSKFKDDYGNEYNVTFFYGDLPSSTVAKELASLYNLEKKHDKMVCEKTLNNIEPKDVEHT